MNTLVGASVQFARALFTRGTDIFGPEEIRQVFEIEVEEVPPIQFSEEELKRARELEQILVLFAPDLSLKAIHEAIHDILGNRTSDGRPLLYPVDWYAGEDFYTSQSVRAGWRLVSQECISNSKENNYLEQTDVLIHYLGQVYDGFEMPFEVLEAIEEYTDTKQELEELLKRDLQEAARRLTGLKLNKLFRETPAEALYVLALYEAVNHERLLSNTWSWTNMVSSRGGVVFVGNVAEYGVLVSSDAYPRGRYDSLGIRFSRGVIS